MENKEKYPCPVCGNATLDGIATDDTCSVCGWYDEWYQRENRDIAFANGKWTLNDAVSAWKSGKTIKRIFPNKGSYKNQ